MLDDLLHFLTRKQLEITQIALTMTRIVDINRDCSWSGKVQCDTNCFDLLIKELGESVGKIPLRSMRNVMWGIQE